VSFFLHRPIYGDNKIRTIGELRMKKSLRLSVWFTAILILGLSIITPIKALAWGSYGHAWGTCWAKTFCPVYRTTISCQAYDVYWGYYYLPCSSGFIDGVSVTCSQYDARTNLWIPYTRFCF